MEQCPAVIPQWKAPPRKIRGTTCLLCKCRPGKPSIPRRVRRWESGQGGRQDRLQINESWPAPSWGLVLNKRVENVSHLLALGLRTSAAKAALANSILGSIKWSIQESCGVDPAQFPERWDFDLSQKATMFAHSSEVCDYVSYLLYWFVGSLKGFPIPRYFKMRMPQVGN